MSLQPATRLAAASSTRSGVRAFSCTAAAHAKPRRANDATDVMGLRKMEEFRHDDIPTLGHRMLQRKRELLHYARLADSEMPKLKAFAKPYQPPAPDAILRVRSHHYQGDPHPSTRKAVVTVTLEDLQRTGALKSDAAVHKFKLLAGVRFSDERQSVKVACERFPEEAQNVRWAAERIELLVKEANTSPEEFADVPLDRRHELVRESKRLGMARRSAPSLKDFPKEWL